MTGSCFDSDQKSAGSINRAEIFKEDNANTVWLQVQREELLQVHYTAQRQRISTNEASPLPHAVLMYHAL